MNNLFFCERCGTTVRNDTNDDTTEKLCSQCQKYQTDMNFDVKYTELISGVSKEKKTSLLIFDDDNDVEKKFTGIYDNVGYKELYGLNNETKLLTWLCATPAENYAQQCHLCVYARFAFKIEQEIPRGKYIQVVPYHTEIIRPDFCVKCPFHFDRRYLVQWFEDMYKAKAQELLDLFMKKHKSLFEIKGMKRINVLRKR